jgi:thiamine biosynthesis protein ThiS
VSLDKTFPIEIVINGESRSVPQGLFLDSLLAHLEIPANRVAVERNRAIVRKPEWGATEILAGDQLEIVWFVGGGRA